ncbi:receptor tyrosine-protein kinase erbB-2-like [Scleropages formosus]|uniref:receptor protein-tyrosine kinase n=1 Tax=Scleropages formosus TaxID=113540 RepID=A0A0P7XN65_SCLFO|nr:receptor tyrosine-protein kinase erbB-2-like [Scleropages formosus]
MFLEATLLKIKHEADRKIPQWLLVFTWAFLIPPSVCLGTDMKLTLPSSPANQYKILELLYTGCEVVHGNLEITHLHGTPDLSFLQGIVEVQGYVLIAHLSVASVPLDNLRIIRGSQLYNSSYALAVVDNVGLTELRMRSLTEILLGGVYIGGNPSLCFPDPQKIQWNDTLDEQNTHKHLYLQQRSPNCQSCSPSCKNRACWGKTDQDCQTLTHLQCASGCLRCKGPQSNDCCHKQCAAGCTGPKDTDCLACRHFNDSRICKDSCPPPTIYDSVAYQSKPNKDKKYSLGATCVKECPQNYLAMPVACTKVCPKANQEVITILSNGEESQKCEKCDGECPKVCYGLGMDTLQGVRAVNASNIKLFSGCEKIFGSLAFLPETFHGDPVTNTSALEPTQLDVFQSLRELTGYLYIEAWPANWTDLGVFENLEVIRGRMLYRGVFSLGVQYLHVESLGLRSLRRVSGGLILLHGNHRLCYTTSIPWAALMHPMEGPHLILSDNRSPEECGAAGQSCHHLCADERCWGPGPSQCVSCLKFRRGTECVEECNIQQGLEREYVEGRTCVRCHPECRPMNGSESCYGQEANQCRECRHFQDGDTCVPRCPSGMKGEQHNVWKYANTTGHCLPCSINCTISCNVLDDRGCPVHPRAGPGTSIAAAVGGLLLFLILAALLVFYLRRQKHLKKKEAMRRNNPEEHGVRERAHSAERDSEYYRVLMGRAFSALCYQSAEHSLDWEIQTGGRSMNLSVSTLGRSQYPTLPMGATVKGQWGPSYSVLARSASHRSAGDQSDSVFLDAMPESGSHLNGMGPGLRYYEEPTLAGGGDSHVETDGPVAFSSQTLSQGGWGQPEYVNQAMQSGGTGCAERPSTLPRRASGGPRRLCSGLAPGSSVENPEYLVPIAGHSPAFDNPFYVDVAKARAMGADMEGPPPPRLPNGFVTPTAENPEYLGLADPWSRQRERGPT